MSLYIVSGVLRTRRRSDVHKCASRTIMRAKRAFFKTYTAPGIPEVRPNLVVLEYPLLYTNFQGHRPLGSEKRGCLKVLPCMGLEDIGHVTQNI